MAKTATKKTSIIVNTREYDTTLLAPIVIASLGTTMYHCGPDMDVKIVSKIAIIQAKAVYDELYPE